MNDTMIRVSMDENRISMKNFRFDFGGKKNAQGYTYVDSKW